MIVWWIAWFTSVQVHVHCIVFLVSADLALIIAAAVIASVPILGIRAHAETVAGAFHWDAPANFGSWPVHLIATV